jgi:hypothetical protein
LNLGSLLASQATKQQKGLTNMAGTKSTKTAQTTSEEPTKAQLQKRMEKAREDITQTVEDIKETVTEQYETVKETVTDALDWREHFRKHTLAWSLGALGVGYLVGTSIANSLSSDTNKRGRKSEGLLAELYALGDNLSEELSEMANTILLPALGKKIKDVTGIDVSDKLQLSRTPSRRASKPAARKGGAKKGAAKKATSKKRAASKKGAKKAGAK